MDNIKVEDRGKYLPLGSVVMLKEAQKRLMIIGYTPVNLEKKDKIYDYLGCIYPEGILISNYNIMFNHNDIKTIYYVGLYDEETTKFLQKLKLYDQKSSEKNSK